MDDTLNLPSVDQLYADSPLSPERLTEMLAHAVDPDTPDPGVEIPGDDGGDSARVDLDEFDDTGDSADTAGAHSPADDIPDALADAGDDTALDPFADDLTDGDGDGAAAGDAGASYPEADPDDPLADF
ncbi:MAG TPA: hypothetical protein H9751_11115 [Candidatus Corynebacterium faecigallinarum]|uniref:Uncharacterized protein n=1 Tax=Candidatus Corynebacterium faecigallinarum TaxID=2838528 RepID=A0A9D2QGC3_9CORY|nr:hypothetical protein [Candidatus Corynebacterium faecigallinarum]